MVSVMPDGYRDNGYFPDDPKNEPPPAWAVPHVDPYALIPGWVVVVIVFAIFLVALTAYRANATPILGQEPMYVSDTCRGGFVSKVLADAQKQGYIITQLTPEQIGHVMTHFPAVRDEEIDEGFVARPAHGDVPMYLMFAAHGCFVDAAKLEYQQTFELLMMPWHSRAG